MTMELKNIREYAELMREYGLTGVEINQDGCVVRLERNAARNNGVTTPETVKEQNASVNKENVYQKQSSCHLWWEYFTLHRLRMQSPL